MRGSCDTDGRVLPRFKNKRQAVDISNQIESDISAYLFTITIMNGAVGVATGTAVALAGLGDPLLWGTVAFLLNYVPILGPMIGVVIFLLAGLLTIDTLWLAFLPAALYLAIHLVEGETSRRCFLLGGLRSIRCSSSSRWCSGTGCGEFRARSLPRRCWRSPKSFAIASSP